MKKLTLLFIFALTLQSVFAQTSDKKWGIGTGVGAYGTFDKSDIGFMPELYLSRYLSPKLDLMLKGDMGLFNSKLISDVDLFNTSLNLRYKLSDESRNFRPYLYAGPGLLSDNNESKANFNLGLGGKYYISQATAFYLEAGYINGIETTSAGKNTRDNFWKATIGMEFDFGKAKDSDMDGVSDKKDKCPNTPSGVAVDSKGCPIDSDGDGVADYLDNCPEVAGATSLKGCPDTDKDGVADKDDACPEVAGVPALKGCPDSDGDGVADKDDQCANTPKGTKVDSKGCPLDQDNDGVPDSQDECPTVFGVKENKGCPEKPKPVKEIEKVVIEPVYFDSNKATFEGSEKAKIDKLVLFLKANNNYDVKVTGYADDSGDAAHNLSLSKNRAAEVVKSILSEGIKKNRIALQEGLGEANPAASNVSPEGRAQNRRVEFEVVKTK